MTTYTYVCEHCGFWTHGLNDYLGHACDPGDRALFQYQIAVFQHGKGLQDAL